MDSSTRINGRATTASFSRVTGLVVNLGNGTDSLQLGEDKGTSMLLSRDLTVTGGTGDKTVQILADLNVGGNVSITTSVGDDVFEAAGTFYVHGDMYLNPNRGNNTVTIVPSGGTNTVVGDLTVLNGRGASSTSVFDTSVVGDLNLTSSGIASAPSDIFFGVSSGDVKAAVIGSAVVGLNLGGGSINLTDTNIAGNLTVNAAVASDASAPAINIAVGSLVNDSESGVAGNLVVNAGAPINLQLGTQEGGVARTLNIGGFTQLRTGNGADNISMNGLVSRLDTRVNTAGGDDLISIDDSLVFGVLRLSMGDGADTLLIEGNENTSGRTEFMNAVAVDLGNDDDSLLVGVLGDATRSVISHVGPTRFDGGAGFNRLLNSSSNLSTSDGDPDSTFVNFQ